jgi:hypothetical protein
MALIDLKNTGGGRRSDEKLIMKATRARREDLVKQIVRMRPTHVAVAGKAWVPFAAYIMWEAVTPGVRVFRIHHPSSRVLTDKEYYEHIRDGLRNAIRR